MLTREQIKEVQGEAREKGTAIQALLKEKGIPEHQYFWWWMRKYAREIVPEGFLPVANGSLPVVIGAVLHRVRTLPGMIGKILPGCRSRLTPAASSSR